MMRNNLLLETSHDVKKIKENKQSIGFIFGGWVFLYINRMGNIVFIGCVF